MARDDSAIELEIDGTREGDCSFNSLNESSWADRRCLLEGRPSMIGARGKREDESTGGTAARPISL